MKVSKTPDTLNININNTNLKQDEEFKYLGGIFAEDGRMNKGNRKGQQCQLPACPTTETSRYSNVDKEQNHKLFLRTNIHIPIPNLDHHQDFGGQNYNLRNEMLKEDCQQDQKRHVSQHQNQRNGRDKEYPPYSTSEDQMVLTSHTTANTPPS